MELDIFRAYAAVGHVLCLCVGGPLLGVANLRVQEGENELGDSRIKETNSGMVYKSHLSFRVPFPAYRTSKKQTPTPPPPPTLGRRELQEVYSFRLEAEVDKAGAEKGAPANQGSTTGP